MLLGLFGAISSFGDDNTRQYAAHAQTELAAASSRSQSAPDSLEAAWRLAQTCFDAGEFSTNNAERAALANRGIEAAKSAIRLNDDSAAAHYYLGMNLGQLARTKSLGALKLVDQMVVEFSRALALDDHFDYAGPERNLGLLYRDAPAIGSVGSRTKARHHLQRAALLEPDYPENRLNLVETYYHWGEYEAARKQLSTLMGLLPAARQKLTAPGLAPAWSDWDARIKTLNTKLNEPLKKLTAPSQR